MLFSPLVFARPTMTLTVSRMKIVLLNREQWKFVNPSRRTTKYIRFVHFFFVVSGNRSLPPSRSRIRKKVPRKWRADMGGHEDSSDLSKSRHRRLQLGCASARLVFNNRIIFSEISLKLHKWSNFWFQVSSPTKFCVELFVVFSPPTVFGAKDLFFCCSSAFAVPQTCACCLKLASWHQF